MGKEERSQRALLRIDSAISTRPDEENSDFILDLDLENDKTSFFLGIQILKRNQKLN